MYPALLLLMIVPLAAFLSAHDAFGHGIGADTAPPISFAGMNVTVTTQLSPSDITAGKVDDANMRIQFYNADTGDIFEEVAYRVSISRSNELIARELFYDRDGTLDVEIRPIDTCLASKLIDCSKTFGDIHPIAGGYMAYGEGRPLVTGPIFDKGGLYHIRVNIEGASSPRTLIEQADQEHLTFDTFVSVAQEQDFVIQTAHAAELPVLIKTYYDDVSNLAYSPADHSLSFDMPFMWDPEHISLVQYVHEEVRLPNAPPYNDVTDFIGYINDIEVDSDVIRMEPFNENNNTIVHFVVFGKELERINGIMDESRQGSDIMTFRIVPSEEEEKNAVDFYLVNPITHEPAGSTATISWDAGLDINDEIPLEITFFDEAGILLKDVMYAYDIYDEAGILLQSGGYEDLSDPGIYAFEGIDIQKITFPSYQKYRMDVAILGLGLEYTSTYSGIGSVIVDFGPPDNDGTPSPEGNGDTATVPVTDATSIPSWIKTNAALWADGVLSDSEFISALQYLIENGIIIISGTPATAAATDGIPSWIKTNAELWSDDIIDDQTFAGAIQWLISNGIISV